MTKDVFLMLVQLSTAVFLAATTVILWRNRR